MEMNKPNPFRRKPAKLRTLFIRYLVAFFLGAIGLVLFAVLLFMGLLAAGAIIPANQAELQVSEAAAGIASGRPVSLDAPDVLFKYAKFDSTGELLEHSLTEKQSARAWELLAGDISRYRFPYGYVKVSNGDETYILRYTVSAQFGSPVLRKFLPTAELTFFALFFLAFLGWTVLLASVFGRRLARKMDGLEEAVRHIQAQDLEFSVRFGGIAEIDRILLSMEQMKNALKQSLERQWNLERSRRDQISALAHDIKTPLTIARGNVELLRETELNEDQEAFAGYIADSVRRMESYMNALIDITKTENMPSLRPETVETEPFLRKIGEQLQALAALKRLVPEVNAGRLPDTFHADSALLERALMNIFSNAAEHAPEGSRLSLTVDAEGCRIRFRVDDEGPGFSPEALRLATEQFYMGDSSRRANGHYGMGLYIARQIALLHGGELHIANSDATGGAAVTVEIPASFSGHV